MNVLVFSRNRKLPEKLKLKRRKGLVNDVSFVALEQFSGRLKEINTPTLCYLDLSGIEEKQIQTYLRGLKKKDNIVFGIIDQTGKIKDVAGLFHDGAVDYLNRHTLDGAVGVRRLTRIREFVQGIHPTLLEAAAASAREQREAPYLLSGNDWTAVIPGREYTFSMMFIELDGREQMEKSYGTKNLSIALSSFRNFIDGFVRKFGGRLWIWFSFGGIILFPFDGKTCPALTCGFRLKLFKHLYDIEGSHFPHFLSFRTALQIGNTPYTEENTGHIVSDSLNSIFHLGRQFVQPGNFYATEEVMKFGHPVLRDYFLSAGTFEGRNILRMRVPVHRHKRK